MEHTIQDRKIITKCKFNKIILDSLFLDPSLSWKAVFYLLTLAGMDSRNQLTNEKKFLQRLGRNERSIDDIFGQLFVPLWQGIYDRLVV